MEEGLRQCRVVFPPSDKRALGVCTPVEQQEDGWVMEYRAMGPEPGNPDPAGTVYIALDLFLSAVGSYWV